MKYDAAIGAHILDDEEVKALMDRSFAKALGKEFRQPDGSPPVWIRDSVEIIQDDFPHLFGKADPQ